MPGLSQLRQFSEDIKNLGDEVQIRRMRGEKPVFLPVPDVPDVNDSNDFMLGMPDPNAKEEDNAPAAPGVDMSNTEDIDLASLGIPGLGGEPAPAASSENIEIPPELASILGTPAGGASSADDVEMPDLSDFLDEPVAPASQSAPDVPDFSADTGANAVSDVPDFSSDAGAATIPDVPDFSADTLIPGHTDSSTDAGANAVPDGPDLSDALSAGSMDNLDDFGDLSSLITPPDAEASAEGLGGEEEADVSPDSLDIPDDMSLPSDFGADENLEVPEGIPTMDELLPEEDEENPVALDQASLDALFKTSDAAGEGQSNEGEQESSEADSAEVAADSADTADFSLDSADAGGVPDFSDTGDFEQAGEPSAASDFADNTDISEPAESAVLSDTAEPSADADFAEISEPAASADTTESAPAGDSDASAFSLPDDFGFSGDEIDMGSESAGDVSGELPAVDAEGAEGGASPAADASAPAADASAPATDFSMDDFSMDSLPPLDDFESTAGESPAAPATDLTVDVSTEGLDAAQPDTSSAPASDDFASMFDTSGLDFPAGMDSASGETPDASMSVPGDMFDTSEMDGLDFSSEAGSGDASPVLPFDNDFPVTGENAGDDFELTDDFEIPGFSDTDTAPDDKKGGFRVDSPDFSKAKADRPPNTLTEEEYEKFKKNLAGYPLNLRIAVEDFIVKDEFKDDVIFEVVEKVLKKASARQLAGHLEKLLDISIDVPRDFERRSVAEYEAYKQSFQYQLKNRILPMAVAGVVLAILGFFMFQAGKRFIYQPVMASRLYNQGYTMLENNEYPQSEELFQQAVSYRPVKKWFFRYAKGYREHKQFERAAQMYRNILGLFNYDKQAGLEYARMELYERANYARAEEIVRRSVLDHYINDSAGILLLGDIFLEWAEVDPEKYELARQEYSNLIQLYGPTDLYMSRMMRYFIRTDNLPNVLSLKNRFYSNKKSLGADDWTELSGYLLDKLYGNLSKTEESLRSSIEDVLDMLETAVKLNPVNPVARYNLSRYFLKNNNDASARREMSIALDLFEKAPVRTRKNTYREINGNRVLGELFARDREYIKAQESYTKGIDVYTEEHEKTGLEGDENTGKLYADMGDLDYFITGDMDAALSNYQTALGMKNDTPSLNYRIGAIHYNKKNYEKALGSFIKTAETKGADPSLLLSLGNTLSLRGDNFAAQGYYSDLITRLNNDRARRVIFNPHVDDDDNALLDLFVKANNNLGVTLYRLARQTGDSGKNAEALVRLSDSIRAWDAYTRNPETMKRLEGSNLAAQNSKYITHPYSDFEPAIYTDIPKTLDGEAKLE